jgi:GNAT superfamily N-acetyltransferase
MEAGAEIAMVSPAGEEPMRLKIRQARPGDRKAIHAMLREFIAYFAEIDAATVADDPYSDRELAKAAGLGFVRDPLCAALIAEADGRPVGYLAYHFGVWEIYPALFVAGLFVRKSARGNGVGRALMDAAQDLAAARKATHIAWMVWRKNAPAIGFYEHLGAEIYDTNMQMVWKLPKPVRKNRTRTRARKARPAKGGRKP